MVLSRRGSGLPIVVIHGGPDFDDRYLLPDFDRLAGRLIYYDQRGRGRSRGDVGVDAIRIERYVDDLDAIRCPFALDPMTIRGHSWSGYVAMHYALAHPEHVSWMILLNSAPVECAAHIADALPGARGSM